MPTTCIARVCHCIPVLVYTEALCFLGNCYQLTLPLSSVLELAPKAGSSSLTRVCGNNSPPGSRLRVWGQTVPCSTHTGSLQLVTGHSEGHTCPHINDKLYLPGVSIHSQEVYRKEKEYNVVLMKVEVSKEKNTQKPQMPYLRFKFDHIQCKFLSSLFSPEDKDLFCHKNSLSDYAKFTIQFSPTEVHKSPPAPVTWMKDSIARTGGPSLPQFKFPEDLL